MNGWSGFTKRSSLVLLVSSLALPWSPLAVHSRAETYVSGKVLTADGMIATSGVVALEKGELHNNKFLVGGEIQPDGSFSLPLPSGGPWGLHVYSEGYIYFPMQIQVQEGLNNDVPVILPVDSKTADDPRISKIRFKEVTGEVMQITMQVDDPDGNLGPQMLAVDTKRLKAYRLIPAGGDLEDKKADFPTGQYVSPFISAALEEEDPGDWRFVVADHQCSNGPIYDGRSRRVFRSPVPHEEPVSCEIPGIWKSNFEKTYRFTRETAGEYRGEELDGELTIERMVQKNNEVQVGFRFEGEQGKATLTLQCKDRRVTLEGRFTLPKRSGKWLFTKLKDAAAPRTGKELFMANCSVCHFPDRKDVKVGPGLKGVFENPRLPGTGRPTEESIVREQIQKGGIKMPPFPGLTEEEVSRIIDHLKSL